jgi:hypothetical protein
MQEIRRRERPIPDERTQVMAFVKTALPPLVARYALLAMRQAVALPQVRALIIGLVMLVLAWLFLPAFVFGVVVWLATASSAAATVSALTATVLCGVILGVVIARLYMSWRAFRLRYFGIR